MNCLSIVEVLRFLRSAKCLYLYKSDLSLSAWDLLDSKEEHFTWNEACVSSCMVLYISLIRERTNLRK